MSDLPVTDTAPRPRRFRNILLTILLAFAGGIALAIWAVTSWKPAKEYLVPNVATPAAKQAALTPPPAASTGAPAAATPPTLLLPPLTTETRIAALEARIASLSQSAGGPLGNSRRAEGLLLAFAARRAIDRGLQLGYLESELSDYFGPTQPKAVAQVINASRQPSTLAMLKTELDRIAPTLSGNDPDEGFFAALQREISGLFIVRDAGAPPSAAKDRIAHAQELVDIGRIDQALAEIARLGNRPQAEKWMAMARRNIEANTALDLLEASALMTPKAAEPVQAEPVVGPPDPERIPEPVAPAKPDAATGIF